MMTDVVSSTELWAEHGTGMDRAIEELSADIRHHVHGNGGTVVQARGEGDSHFAVFCRASSAARAAVELQRARSNAGWPAVRIALHTAEAEPCDGDYLGVMVNRTARLRSTAHGGQTVCSLVVAELIAGAEGLHVISLGAHRVRDFPARIELFQVSGSTRPGRFPPLRTEDVAAAPVMTFVVTDQVGSRGRIDAAPGGLAEWQGELYRALRDVADSRQGRFFKFVGDGCLVGFEDPLAAVEFAEEVCGARLGVRAAVAAGRTDIVEGEPSSRAVWQAARHVQTLESGQVWISPLVRSLVGHEPEATASAR